jgi:hypothetical protein
LTKTLDKTTGKSPGKAKRPVSAERPAFSGERREEIPVYKQTPCQIAGKYYFFELTGILGNNRRRYQSKNEKYPIICTTRPHYLYK